jgi:hypothetical protein
MPTLDDLPTLAQIAAPTGDDLFPIYDLTADGSSKVRKVSLNQINGLSATDTTGPAVLSNAAAIATRLTINSSGTTALLPVASGVLRDIIIMNGNASSVVTVTVSGATTNIFSSATAAGAAAASITIPLSTTGRFLSNGTNWYRTH